MRITKVYTRKGDGGSTRLVGGRSVTKTDARIEAYGTIDELNAVVGLVRTHNLAGDGAQGHEVLEPMLHRIQNDLFDVGTLLATLPEDHWEGMPKVDDARVEALEQWMDELNLVLPPLEEFILPGGGLVGAHFHLARTVCRRAERRVLAVPGAPRPAVAYLNRLSDFFFVAGRWAAKAHGEREFLWER